MEGLEISGSRITMEKPYLSISGIDFFGHCTFQKAALPLTLHVHPQCMEVVFVMGGEQNYYTENHRYSVVGGNAFLSYFNQAHMSGENFQGLGEIYWFQLNLSDPEHFLGFSPELSLYVTDRLLALNRHIFSFDKSFAALLKNTFDRFLSQGTSPTALASLMHLISLIPECIGNTHRLENRLAVLEDYIDSHIAEPISIRDLSEISGFSPSTVSHRFKEYYGRTPGEYINYKKILKAKSLLAAGHSVTDTAMALGFNSGDYFSTVYKKFTGRCPSRNY